MMIVKLLHKLAGVRTVGALLVRPQYAIYAAFDHAMFVGKGHIVYQGAVKASVPAIEAVRICLLS
jgi:hypothetical protein